MIHYFKNLSSLCITSQLQRVFTVLLAFVLDAAAFNFQAVKRQIDFDFKKMSERLLQKFRNVITH